MEEVQVRPADRGPRDADDGVGRLDELAASGTSSTRTTRPPRRTRPRARPSVLVGELGVAPCRSDGRARSRRSRTGRSWAGRRAPAASPASCPRPGRGHRARRPSTGSRARVITYVRALALAPDRPGRRRGTRRATGPGSPTRRPAHRGRVRPRSGTRCRPPSPSRPRGNRSDALIWPTRSWNHGSVGNRGTDAYPSSSGRPAYAGRPAPARSRPTAYEVAEDQREADDVEHHVGGDRRHDRAAPFVDPGQREPGARS